MKCNNFRNKEFACKKKKKIFVVKENKREYVLENTSRKEICQIKIDNGYITNTNVRKCDYGFLICNDNYIILVELKGTDFLHAVEQINSTLELLNNELKNMKVSARIVLARVSAPNIENDPKYLKLKKTIKSQNGDIEYRSGKMLEKI